MKLGHLIPAALLLALLACSQQAVPEMSADGTTPISAKNAQRPPSEPLEISRGVDQRLAVPIGEAGTKSTGQLAVWVLEPLKGTPVKGTVLFLHGFMGRHQEVENAGRALRAAGYRAVLPDLRGFGESTGAQFTFGVQDAKDLTQLTDYLQQHQLAGKTIGVYGTSYGAAAAIMYAAADPRVKTVIAVAPFATIRDEVPSFSRHVLGRVTGGAASALLSDSDLNAIANVAADLIRMDLDTAKPVDAIKQIHVPVLLIHGDADTIVPHSSSEQLRAANPTAQLLTIHDRGHLDLCFDIPGELQQVTREWFEAHLRAIESLAVTPLNR